MCVLLVEDDDLLRETLADYLELHDFDVVLARTGDEAAVLIDNPPHRFSVLLTDFNMPDSRNGLDVASHMKARHPHVHVFIVTGRPDAVVAVRGAEAAITVIAKPFAPRAMIDQISSLVEHQPVTNRLADGPPPHPRMFANSPRSLSW